jgi:hypothetical protein
MIPERYGGRPEPEVLVQRLRADVPSGGDDRHALDRPGREPGESSSQQPVSDALATIRMVDAEEPDCRSSFRAEMKREITHREVIVFGHDDVVRIATTTFLDPDTIQLVTAIPVEVLVEVEPCIAMRRARNSAQPGDIGGTCGPDRCGGVGEADLEISLERDTHVNEAESGILE